MENNLNLYKQSVMTMCKYKGWDTCSVEKVWLLLIEEIGELAGSIRRNNNYFKDKKKIKIEDELGDVFSYLFQIAGMLDIDLNKMWNTNQKKSLQKQYINKPKDNIFIKSNDPRCQIHSKYCSNRAENRRMVQNASQYDNSK